MERETNPTKRPYERPQLIKVNVDPVKDLLFTGAKTSSTDPGCGGDPQNHGT